MATTLAARLAQANAGELDHRGLVQALANDEREHRTSLVASGLGRLAIRLGVDVRFTQANSMLRFLANGRDRGAWEKRLASFIKPGVLVLDNFAVREFTETETLDLYELITGRPGKSMIVTSGRPPEEWYNLFPDKALPLAEAFLDRLVNANHHIVMDGPGYRTQQRPGHTTTQRNTSGKAA